MWEKFHQGGWAMWPLAFVALLGVAFILWRLIVIAKASVNTRKFLEKIKYALKEGGVEAAMDVCTKTRGPLAAIFYSGLSRADRGIEAVEKAIEEAGAIEMAFLEKGMVWLSFVINVAPMIGFLGTVSGMINAFDAIAKAGDVEPTIVAGGISEALITTATGLIIAIPVQAFYNFFISQIDKIVIEMEESSTVLVEYLLENKQKS